MWTICDLALHILINKLKSVDMREYTLDQVHISRMYFQEQNSSFENNKEYLSQEFMMITQNEDFESNLNNNAGPAPKRPADTFSEDDIKRVKTE